MNLTFGTDPEAFYCANRTILPAEIVFQHNGIQGDHYDLECGRLYIDGAAIEFQPNPSTSIVEVTSNLKELLRYGYYLAAQVSGVYLKLAAQMPFDLNWCQVNPELARFGCDPDLSAYGEECCPATIDAGKHPMRYAGGHLHVGVIDNPDYFNGERYGETLAASCARLLDRTVGLLAMVVAHNLDSERRGIYGRPGVYRHQPWGVEYRTPSNLIIAAPRCFEQVLGMVERTIPLLEKPDMYELAIEVAPDDIVVGILKSDSIKDAGDMWHRVCHALFGEAWAIATIPYTAGPTSWGYPGWDK